MYDVIEVYLEAARGDQEIANAADRIEAAGRGRPPDEYEAWLGDSLVATLLGR